LSIKIIFIIVYSSFTNRDILYIVLAGLKLALLIIGQVVRPLKGGV